MNVCGAIAGAIVGGFLLLPHFGSRRSLLVCAALYLASAVVLAWASPRRRGALAATAVAGVAFVPAARVMPDPFLDFTLARDVLDEDGVMLQWVGHRPETQYRLLVRSFLRVFPHATLWEGGTLLVGTKRPLTISRSAFDRRLTSDPTRLALEDVGLGSFDALIAKYVAGSDAIRTFVGPGEVLSDDRPRLEFHRSLPGERGQVDLSALVAQRGSPPVVN